MSFWSLAAAAPDRRAVVDADGRATSAAALLAAANQASHGLRALGLQRGDTVAVALKNEVAFLELHLAATQLGLYLVPINTHLAPPEIALIVDDCDAKVLVACDKTAAACEKTTVAHRFATCAAPGFRPYAELKAGQPSTPPDDRRAGAIMTYTSGTTGRPKGVRRPLMDAPPEVAADALAGFLGLFGISGSDGVHLVVAPLYHTAVASFALNHLHLGHTVVLTERFVPEQALELIARHRVTASHMVPTQLRRLLALPEEARGRHDLSSLRHLIHSAAPCPVELKQRVLAWLGPVVYEYYAASEGGGTLATPEGWLAHPGTVGKAWPISTIRVLGDDGAECAPGEVGTVWMCMDKHRFEYHKDQAKTQASRRGEFFTVGDAGYLDAEGWLFLVDRKQDLIISGGVNIYPAEIEAVLAVHPRVADVAVFGIPDDDWGEQVMAVVEPVGGAVAGEGLADELRAYCRDRLASFKIPRAIELTDELPRDPNGKLYKRRLRDPYWQGRERAI